MIDDKNKKNFIQELKFKDFEATTVVPLQDLYLLSREFFKQNSVK